MPSRSCGARGATEPGVMLVRLIEPWLLAGRDAVVDVPPIVGRHLDGIDAGTFDSGNEVEHALDPKPAGEPQQDLAAWLDTGNGRHRLARATGAQDIDARERGAVVVSLP